MANSKEQMIIDGETVLRQTIKKLNKLIREEVTTYNKSAAKKGYHTWDYNEVYKAIANAFAGENLAVEAANARKPLYLSMKYPTLIAYNHFLGSILNNMQKYTIGKAIDYAKVNSRFPALYYPYYNTCGELKYEYMLDGINAVRAEMSRIYGKNNISINCLDAVMNERKAKEEARAKMKAATKLAKSQTAKKVATKVFGTTAPQTKQAHEVNLWEEEAALEERHEFLRETAGEIGFDEDGTPVTAVKDNDGCLIWVYVDGSVYHGNVYDENRDACLEQEKE